MIDIKTCIEIIKEKHAGQKRKQGTPYYLHPIAVANFLKEKGFPEEYQIVGLFHDLLEDTDTTYEEIERWTNEDIAEAVVIVTKKKGYNMDDYIKRIKSNQIAKMVKISDRIHNLSETTLAPMEFQKKYIDETKKWYVDLASGTIMEQDLENALHRVEENYRGLCTSTKKDTDFDFEL